MKRKYGVMIATWILWFISILVPLFCVVLKRVPQRFLTVQFLVILLLGILLCVQWIWLRRAERLQIRRSVARSRAQAWQRCKA